MFENIEKEYKKNSKERKFNTFYWTCILIIIILTNFLSKAFNNFNSIKSYVMYILIFIAIITYFIVDYKISMKKLKINKKEKVINKLKKYANYNHQKSIDDLVESLANYNYKSKDDLKIAIDYFNCKCPVKIESSFIGWIVSAALTLSSFAELAYDANSKTIDYDKMFVILGSAIGFIICFLIISLFIKLIINSVILSKTKIQSQISADLSFIYLNFDEYKNKFTKQ